MTITMKNDARIFAALCSAINRRYPYIGKAVHEIELKEEDGSGFDELVLFRVNGDKKVCVCSVLLPQTEVDNAF